MSCLPLTLHKYSESLAVSPHALTQAQRKAKLTVTRVPGTLPAWAFFLQGGPQEHKVSDLLKLLLLGGFCNDQLWLPVLSLGSVDQGWKLG